jgi:hypothetical protein
MRTILLLAVLAAPAFAQGSIFPDKNAKTAAKQLEASAINEDVRAFLKLKMKAHAKEMKELSVAVATVRLGEVQRLAQDIANEARLDSSVGPAAKLPPRFFELQEEGKKRAQALSDAAKANEMSGSLEKYGQVVENCMACHAAFKAQVQAK